MEKTEKGALHSLDAQTMFLQRVTNQKAVENIRYILEKRESWTTPTPRDCLYFILQEIGEISDAMMRLGHTDREYFRCNDREVDLEMEIGDAEVMLCTLATLLDIDMEKAVDKSLSKFMKKFGGENENDLQD